MDGVPVAAVLTTKPIRCSVTPVVEDWVDDWVVVGAVVVMVVVGAAVVVVTTVAVVGMADVVDEVFVVGGLLVVEGMPLVVAAVVVFGSKRSQPDKESANTAIAKIRTRKRDLFSKSRGSFDLVTVTHILHDIETASRPLAWRGTSLWPNQLLRIVLFIYSL